MIELKTKMLTARVTEKTSERLAIASDYYGVSKSYITQEAIKLFLSDVLRE